MLRQLVAFYRAMWKTTLRLAQCARHGHLDLCHVEVNRRTGMQLHVHECDWCGATTLSKTEPVDDLTRQVLANVGLPLDPGLTLPEQGEYMH